MYEIAVDKIIGLSFHVYIHNYTNKTKNIAKISMMANSTRKTMKSARNLSFDRIEKHGALLFKNKQKIGVSFTSCCMSSSPYTSYVVDIHLPPAIIISPVILTLGYALVLTMDYVLIKNDMKLAPIISPMKLRGLIAVYHFLLPIIFASKYDFGNISFMLQPWTTALQIVFLAKSDLSIKKWILMLFKVATFQDDSPTADSSREIRIQGLKKIIRGLAKAAFMKFVLDGLLPHDLSDLLGMPVFSTRSLFITYVLAFRIYCMMGITDIIMGLVQCTCLIRFKDIFDNPFMATR